eukprot:UN19404
MHPKFNNSQISSREIARTSKVHHLVDFRDRVHNNHTNNITNQTSKLLHHKRSSSNQGVTHTSRAPLLVDFRGQVLSNHIINTTSQTSKLLRRRRNIISLAWPLARRPHPLPLND